MSRNAFPTSIVPACGIAHVVQVARNRRAGETHPESLARASWRAGTSVSVVSLTPAASCGASSGGIPHRRRAFIPAAIARVDVDAPRARARVNRARRRAHAQPGPLLYGAPAARIASVAARRAHQARREQRLRSRGRSRWPRGRAHADAFVAVSEDTADVARAIASASPSALLHVVPNGVPLDAFRADATRAPRCGASSRSPRTRSSSGAWGGSSSRRITRCSSARWRRCWAERRASCSSARG